MDYVQLNKSRTPRTDGPQQRLDHKQVFSKIDLPKLSAYWQLPMSEASLEKYSDLDQVTDSSQ